MNLFIRYFAPIDRAWRFQVQGLFRHADVYARRNIVVALTLVLLALDFAPILVLLSFPFVIMTCAATFALIGNVLSKGRRQ